MHTFLLSLPDSRQRRLSALRQIQGSGLSFELVDGVEAGKMRVESLPTEPDVLSWLKTGELNQNYGVVSTQGRLHRVCETPYCTTGYIIEHSLASYILKHHSDCRMPIDHLYAQLSGRGLFYQCIKPLIGIQCGLPSDIQQTP